MVTKWASLTGLVTIPGLGGPTNATDILESVTRQQPGVTKRSSSGLFDPESNADAGLKSTRSPT